MSRARTALVGRTLAMLACFSLCVFAIASGCTGITSLLDRRPPPAPAVKRVVLVVTATPQDDAFVDSIVAGAHKACDESGGRIELTVETTGEGGLEEALRAAANASALAGVGYDLVITHSAAAVEAIKKVSATLPRQQFLLVDAFCDLRNVRSVQFRETEGMFLLGAAAALTSKTGRVGLVGSADVPSYLRLAGAYEQGAKHVRPAVTYIDAYAGAFDDSAKAKELATGLSKRNVDVVMALADGGNAGVFAAKDRRFYTFGTWQDLCAQDPKRILASIVKRPDVPVGEALKLLAAGELPAGRYTYGLKDGALVFCLLANPDHPKTDLPASVLTKVEEVQKAIISGEVKVP